MWTYTELDTWDILDDQENYNDLDSYYGPNEGSRDYLHSEY